MKHLKKATILIILTMLLLVQLVPSIGALTQYDGVSVTFIQQKQTAWCWAACAEMMGKAVYPSSARNQTLVVYILKGTDEESTPNVGGTLSDCANGAAFVSYYNYTFSTSSSILPYQDLVTEMRANHPVVAGLRSESSGHMVVINGTELRDTSSEPEIYIHFVDPWDGQAHMCSYSDFCDGSYTGYEYKTAITVD